MFGDVLKEKVSLLKNTTKRGERSFWKMLRDIATEDIKNCYPEKVDSVNAVPIYYDILSNNLDSIPKELQERTKSNNQEKYRVANRNMWTSNAFHPEGLANQVGVKAERKMNLDRKGNRIIYQWSLEKKEQK